MRNRHRLALAAILALLVAPTAGRSEGFARFAASSTDVARGTSPAAPVVVPAATDAAAE